MREYEGGSKNGKYREILLEELRRTFTSRMQAVISSLGGKSVIEHAWKRCQRQLMMGREEEEMKGNGGEQKLLREERYSLRKKVREEKKKEVKIM